MEVFVVTKSVRTGTQSRVIPSCLCETRKRNHYTMSPCGTTELPLDTRGAIIALYNETRSPTYVARKLGVAKSTVWYTVKQQENSGTSFYMLSVPHAWALA